jgi:hypothetical protein
MYPIKDNRPQCKHANEVMVAVVFLLLMTPVPMLMLVLMLVLVLMKQKCVAKLNGKHSSNKVS